ncbi:hypothetical protein MAUB1S_09732 [Mycolicibacterium aubagnense]
MEIKPPKHDGPYPDRDIDCQQAIERAFQELMENIVAAGWGPQEISEAIGQLAICDDLSRKDVAGFDAHLAIMSVMAKFDAERET